MSVYRKLVQRIFGFLLLVLQVFLSGLSQIFLTLSESFRKVFLVLYFALLDLRSDETTFEAFLNSLNFINFKWGLFSLLCKVFHVCPLKIQYV